MNQFIKTKIKIPSEDRIFNVDPTGLAPVSLLVKGRILLHKLQAQVHKSHFNKFNKKQKPPKSEEFVLTSSGPAVYANSTFWSHYIRLINLVKNDFVDNF